MVADAILDVVFAAVQGILNLFPTVNVDFSSGTSALQPYIANIGQFADVAAIIAGLAVITAGELTIMAIRVTLFVWRLTPLSG